ncbi:MAG: threonine--tRNA ligase [Candidatus Iainarchaeum sp.]|jgi:threonyl-tRNA synthetase|nr:MAG: putative threonine--tRNA ligase 1 [archaeon ADurb.Bin336]
MEKNEEYMEKFWHTTAHVFANALTETFPTTKLAIGPAIEHGFYYDFDLDKNLDAKDLKVLEEKMREVLKRKESMIQKSVSVSEALELFKNNPYKTELINDLVEEGEKTISTYTNGKFIDMCKGPHLESTKEIGAIKLLKISAAYWKGNEKNKQLQRVYGISFKTQKELEEWIELRKKAEENSNIKLGKELDLYMINDMVGRGLPIWCPNGAMLRMQLQDLLVKEQLKQEYSFIITPHIGRTELFKTSGHLANYKEMMYAPIQIDEDEYYLKPMNCPFHITYYAKDPRSYRDLPLRLSEMGTVYRYEKSGELSGLLRVRGFTQDDAHIFCTPEQVKEEFKKVFDLVTKIMGILKLKDFRVRVGTRDPNSSKYVGEEKMWEKATQEIIEVLKEKGINFVVNPGDAAFYGPKADIIVKDALGREWQTGTIQLDYNLPERFNLEYAGSDGQKHRPVMIHRAPFGSFERFTGIIIEHFGGNFPLWLSPEQVRIIPISEKFMEYAKQVKTKLLEAEIRVKLDERNETLGYKIRDAQKNKTPYALIIGAKEVENKTISLRDRKGKQETIGLEEFLDKIVKEIKEKN